MAKRDRRLHVIRSFEQAHCMDGKWKSIKTARQKSIPGFVPLQKSHGNYIDLSQKAPTNADYLANGQWKPPDLARQNLPLGKSWLTIFTLMTVILLLTNLERFSEALKRTRLRFQMILPPTCWNCLTILIYNLFCFYPMIVGTDRRSSVLEWRLFLSKEILSCCPTTDRFSFPCFVSFLLHLFSVHSGQK